MMTYCSTPPPPFPTTLPPSPPVPPSLSAFLFGAIGTEWLGQTRIYSSFVLSAVAVGGASRMERLLWAAADGWVLVVLLVHGQER